MRKKAVILTLIMAIGFVGIFAQIMPMKKFSIVYQETLELNKHRFENLNLIQIGDTVLLSSLIVGDPTIYRWVADEPAVNNGKHDCIWLISQRYYQDINKSMIIEPVEEKKSTEPEAMAKNFPYLLLLGVIAILLLLGYIFQRLPKSEAVNPNTQPPMMRDGLSSDNQTAIRQIAQYEHANPENITKLERCMLVRHSGPQRIEVMMDFRNGTKKSYVIPGELISKVSIKKDDGKTRVEYWRNHCGNRFGAIKNGQFLLPEGWEAVIQDSYKNPEAKTAKQPETEKATTQEAQTPPTTTKFDAEGIATIVRNIPKGASKVAISPDGTITIKMSLKKNK
jgi:hypothetical protein